MNFIPVLYFCIFLLMPLPSRADNTSRVELYARDPLTCGGVHPEWTRCDRDADCVIVPNICGAPQFPAAAAFQTEIANCAKLAADKSIDCTNPRYNGSRQLTPVCVTHICRAKPNR